MHITIKGIKNNNLDIHTLSSFLMSAGIADAVAISDDIKVLSDWNDESIPWDEKKQPSGHDSWTCIALAASNG